MSKKNKKLQLYEKLVNVGVAPALGLIEIFKRSYVVVRCVWQRC